MKDWDGNIGRLKPYLVEMDARLAAVEGRLLDTKEQVKAAETKAPPDPQKTASDAMKSFVDVTDKPAAAPKGASTKS